jgi:hypothetical protein
LISSVQEIVQFPRWVGNVLQGCRPDNPNRLTSAVDD